MKTIGLFCLPVALVLCAGPPADARWGGSQASTGWHCFGSRDNAPAEPSGPGVWRHFIANAVVPKVVVFASASATVPPPTSTGAADLEKQMYELLNRDRSDPSNAAETGGRALPLKWNEKLAEVARAHSRDMLNAGLLGHVDPEGRSPAMRVKAAGIGWQAVAENIAFEPDVASAETAFMSEPRFGHNHRSIILNPKYTEVGVGIVRAPNGWYYITQEFIQEPTSLRASFPDAR